MVPKHCRQRLESPQQSEQTVKSSGEQSCSDQFELSVRSRELSHVNELIQSTPDIREDKVEKARREIEDGTYTVKADKIAEKILASDSDAQNPKPGRDS
jgi:flagellar biosynthesis anti-sigma factor FlgM